MDHVVSFGGSVEYEYLILGAGPAGLQMGHHLSRAGHSYRILEAGEGPGTFFKSFPRHRTLLSCNKVDAGSTDPEVDLRFDWNSLLSEGDGRLLFRDYSRRYFPPADEMVRYLADYADFHELDVRPDTRILRIEKPGPSLFRLTDADGQVYTCRRLIVATGTSKAWVPSIPGISLAESYADVSVDPEDFAGQRVLILGKGDSALETAENLFSTAALLHLAGPGPLAREKVRQGLWREADGGILATCSAAVLDSTVEAIERRDGYFSVVMRTAEGGREEIAYHRVIVCAGFRFDDSIFAEGCRPALTPDGRFPAQTPEWESANVPGLYFAGALMQGAAGSRDAGNIHGFRYAVRSLFRVLEAKHHHREWPWRDVEPTPEGLVEATLERVNRASALWQQPGLLHDVIVVDEEWERATYYEEVPLGHLHAGGLGESGHYYTVALERGEMDGLQPVVRRWCGRRLVSERRLAEDLFGEWKKPDLHVAPLRYFYMAQLLEIAEMGGPEEPGRVHRLAV